MIPRRLATALATLILLAAVAAPARAAGIHEAIDSVQTRMVKLFGAGGLRNLAGYGTGFLASPDGHIVTVWSPLLDADVVTVVLHDGRRYFGRVLATDPSKDLALLKIDATGLPYFDLQAGTATAGPGTAVLAMGNMFKVAAGDEPLTVMHGVISARSELSARRGRFDAPYKGPVYVVDAVTNNPGAAGGALVTLDGRLLGMLGREVKHNQSNTWLNYAMPISELRKPIEDMIAGRHSRPDPLAASSSAQQSSYAPLDFGFVLVPDVVQQTPAYLEEIVPGTQAADLGLLPDDLVVFANGELVHSIRSLQTVLQNLSPGDDLQLIVRRGTNLVSVTFRVPRKK